MTARTALRIGLVLWTVAFIVSFVDFGMTDPSGDGFTAGVNKIGKFLVWQGIAGIVAIAVWVIGSRFERGSGQRRASRVPGGILIAMLLAIGLFVLSSGVLSRLVNPPAPPPAPTTEPAAPALE